MRARSGLPLLFRLLHCFLISLPKNSSYQSCPSTHPAATRLADRRGLRSTSPQPSCRIFFGSWRSVPLVFRGVWMPWRAP
jgi:hypothetical protein